MCLILHNLLSPLILRSHNLEYDSSEEKKPRLIFYNDKDEVVKVRREFFRLYCDGSARTSGQINVGKF